MKKNISQRAIVQIAVFGLLIFLSWSHLKYGIEKAASIDAYCPYGAIESFLTTVTAGGYLQRIWTSSFILMAITIAVTLLFGRVFCSHFCPLGALQEWLRSLGRKLGIKRDVELPAVVDKYARYLKYAIMAAIAYYSFSLGDLFFRNYDPYNALMHFGNEFDEKIPAYAILGVVLASSLLSKSWWCRYFCPLGGFLGIIKKLSPFKITRDSGTCISCSACNRICPANLDIMKAESVNSADCVSCLDCVNDCPAGSLSASVGKRQVSKRAFAMIAAAAFFVPMLAFMATSAWQTKAPSNIVSKTGTIDVENIRGSNTFGKVIKETSVPLEVFVSELGLPSDIDQSTLLKEIGPKYGLKNEAGEPLETEDFREVIRNHLRSSE